ncbi:hypothetical protein EJ02DRAFT_485904 [Clathrospora elynae]|uniref:Uncharacterized protein n=1 Tax=Clathrospora elynae TaxID=706981 RepID=A0A6A5S776_9PLEO|nr:hypothetical protein EJ02DRAFT_485904 [Clathrospora elynae]
MYKAAGEDNVEAVMKPLGPGIYLYEKREIYIAYRWAIGQGRPDVFRWMFRFDATAVERVPTTATRGSLPTVQFLLDEGEAKETFARKSAFVHHDLSMVELLSKFGALITQHLLTSGSKEVQSLGVSGFAQGRAHATIFFYGIIELLNGDHEGLNVVTAKAFATLQKLLEQNDP